MSQAAIKVAEVFVTRLGLKPETAVAASLSLTEEILGKIAFESDWDQWTEDTINNLLDEIPNPDTHTPQRKHDDKR